MSPISKTKLEKFELTLFHDYEYCVTNHGVAIIANAKFLMMVTSRRLDVISVLRRLEKRNDKGTSCNFPSCRLTSKFVLLHELVGCLPILFRVYEMFI